MPHRRIAVQQLMLLLLGILACTPPSVWAASVVPPSGLSSDIQEKEEEKSPDVTIEDTITAKDPAAQDQHHTSSGAASADAARCRWGEHCPETSTHKHDNTSDATSSLPFVSNNNNHNKQGPPEGFVITSRVYTDPSDKLAHFDNVSNISLPYWECGVVGSTTSPLKVKNAYFRHALPRAAPHLWSGTEYGTHPQLLVALHPLELLLNSGEEQSFQAGDVILLEDVLTAGHKIRSNSTDLSALLLTLPQHYHHVGKDRVSLIPPQENDRKAFWCRTGDALDARRLWNERMQQIVFGSIGLGLSSLVAVFLGKVAPLWLSVGVGGMCFITGGTYATIKCGEYLVQEMDLALERRRLVSASMEAEETEEEPPQAHVPLVP